MKQSVRDKLAVIASRLRLSQEKVLVLFGITAPQQISSADIIARASALHAKGQTTHWMSKVHVDLLVLRDSWEEYAGIGSWAEADLAAPGVTTDEERFCRDALETLMPTVGLFDLTARLSDIERAIQLLRKDQVLERLESGGYKGNPQEWAEASFRVSQLYARLTDVHTLRDHNERLRDDMLPADLLSVVKEARYLMRRLDAAADREPNEVEEEAYRSFWDTWQKLSASAQDEFVSAGLEYYLHDLSVVRQPGARRTYGRIRDLLKWSLNYWDTHIDDFQGDESYADRERWAFDETADFLADDAIWEALTKDLFQPVLWTERARRLQPVRLARPDRLNQELRILLVELYHSFVLGQWISVGALGRALLERLIKQRAQALGIDLMWPATGKVQGKRTEKKLEQLVAEVAEKHPHLLQDLECIREAGNKALHRAQRRTGADVAAETLRQEGEALEVLSATKRVIEGLLA